MYNQNYYQPQMMAPNYRQPMQQFQQMPQMPQIPQQMPQPQEETLYVPSEQAAEAYLMAPNSFVRLWDANQQVFYEKRTDQQGRPFPMEKYEFRKVTGSPAPAQPQQTEQYVTRKEFDELVARLDSRNRDKEKERGKQNG